MRAMIYLASGEETGKKPKAIPMKEIAESENIPLKFLEQIMLTLKNAGLLHSRMGVGGGYYLARRPDQITIGEIERVLDGPLAPVKCVSSMAYEPCDCPNETTCALRLVMRDVRDAIADILDNTTLADTIARRKHSA